MNWLLHVAGIDNVSGRWYAFWSGIAGELSWVGAAAVIYRRHNCQARGCWRLGKHAVDGSPWVVCRKHHPQQADLVRRYDVAGRRRNRCLAT